MCFRQKPPVETKVAFLTALPKGYLLEIWKNFRSKLKRFLNLGFYWTEVSPCKCSSGYVDCKFDSLPKKPAKSLIIFASKSKTTYKFLLFDLEKNIPTKIVWSRTLQFFQTYLKLVTKNPNFSLEVGRFWWIFLMMGNNKFPQKSPLDTLKGILTAMLFFFRNPTSLIQNLKTRINVFPKVRFYLKKRLFRLRSQFCQVCWKVFANSSRFIHQNQKLF